MKAIIMILPIPIVLSTTVMHGMEFWERLQQQVNEAKQYQQQEKEERERHEIQWQIDFGYTRLFDAARDNQMQTDEIAWKNIQEAQAKGLIASISPQASAHLLGAARIYNAGLQK